jgi:hypothetical protein
MVETAVAIDSLRTEFRVRFTRTRGSWGGGRGILRVEPNGLLFLAWTRRLIVFPRMQRRYVLGSQIRDVYRQSDGVRIEFRENSRYAVLHFWAEDAAAAARIVRLLPTARTVEFDDGTEPSRPAAGPSRSLIAILVTIGLALVGSAAWWASEQIRERASPPVPVPAARAPSRRAAEVSTSSVRPSLSEAERAQLEANWAGFEERSEALRTQYRVAFDALLDGSLSRDDFTNGLTHWLTPQWTSEQRRLRRMTFPASSEDLREELLRSAENWEAALATYARGLNEEDVRRVQLAFTYMRSAEDAEGRARRIVERARRQ